MVSPFCLHKGKILSIQINEVRMAFYKDIGEKLKMEISTLLSSFAVSIYGGEGVHVEGHKGIAYMSEEEIVLKTKRCNITIKGVGIKIREIGEEDVYVVGKIKAVELGGMSE